MTDAPPPPNSPSPRPTGTSRAYFLERLKREGRADLLAAIENGQLSAYAAAEAAGYVTRRPILGTGSTNQARRRARVVDGEIRSDQLFELWLGPNLYSSLFGSEEELREAWEKHRELVMAQHAHGGRRPRAWWVFDAGDLRYPGYDRERSFLFERGLLADAERFELLDWWKAEFERSYDPDFFYTERPGEIIEGARARREHYKWADIPRFLVETWTASKRRALKKSETTAGT
jgi:hypothetical protein